MNIKEEINLNTLSKDYIIKLIKKGIIDAKDVDVSDFKIEDLAYNYDIAYSYHTPVFSIIGARGMGKTFGFILHSLRRFKKKKYQIVLLRRYQNDVKLYDKNDIFKNFRIMKEFENDELLYKGGIMYVNGEIFGYIIDINTSKKTKGISYKGVRAIAYDEFMAEEGVSGYVEDEFEKVMTIVDTISREAGINDMKLFLLGNATSAINPTLMGFDMIPDFDKEFQGNEKITIHIPKGDLYAKFREENTFVGFLAKDTDYGNQNTKNSLININNNLIYDGGKFKQIMIVKTKNGIIGINIDNDGNIIISDKYNIETSFKFTTSYSLMENDYKLIDVFNSSMITQMRYKIRSGKLFYTNQMAKNKSIEFIKKIGVR